VWRDYALRARGLQLVERAPRGGVTPNRRVSMTHVLRSHE
jgi:hypothetical protein